MKSYIELEKPAHCLECCLRNDDDYCIMQLDEKHEFIEYKSWEQQMENCPIQAGNKGAKMHIKNQLNKGATIEFCLGEKEFKLRNNETVIVEVKDEDYLYLDIVKTLDNI